jgi:hypothetical protein
MAIIRVLKGINGIAGWGNIITNPLGSPLKSLREAVMIGLPSWDPPPPKPPSPPDYELAARVQEAIGMGSQQEKAAFDKAMQTWRNIRDGQPRQPADVPGRRELPPAAQPAKKEGGNG